MDSAFVGMRKPDAEIYTLTLERLGGGLDPGDCVFIDDLEVNCATASELGMAAVVFEGTTQARVEVESALLA